MRTQITVFSSKKITSKKENRPEWVGFNCECLVHGDQQLVGVVMVPASVLPADLQGSNLLPPGEYYADWGMSRDFSTKEIKSRLVEFLPVGAVMRPAAKGENVDKATGEVKEAKKG